MIETYKQLIANQFEATFCMLEPCVDLCAAANWQAPVANLRFSQVAFHTLIFADIYLGRDLKSLKDQHFHRVHASSFGDYEELEDRPQRAEYDKPFIKLYLQHCREKAAATMATETSATLNQQSGFEWLNFSRAEVHVCNVRHIQHHAAQLSLRLRIEMGIEIPWVGSGWKVL